MKRVFAILLACVMVFGVSATVFAADSPSAEIGYNADEAEAATDGITVSAITSDVDGYEAAAELLDDPDSVLAEFTDEAGELAYLLDISGDVEDGSIVLSLADITEDSAVLVLHYEDGAWVEVEAEVGDGTLTIYVDSLSPFAIYILEAEDTEDETDDGEDADDEDTDDEDEDEDETTTEASDADESDETGESGMMLLIAAIAFAAAIGAAVSVKKIRG